jgi:transketolase
VTVRVLDCYSIKPIDTETLVKAARETKAIITVEDHYAVGGLGDAVLEALSEISHPPVHKLAVTKTPRSGTAEELLRFEGIDAGAITRIINEISH